MDHDAQVNAANKLIDMGYLTHNLLTKALEYQCRLPPGQFLPLLQILVDFEYVSNEHMVEVLGEDYLQEQDPIGRILVEQGIVSAQQMEQALQVLNSFSRQHVTDIFIDMGFVTRSEIEQAISRHQIDLSKRLKQAKPTLQATTQHKTAHDIRPDSDTQTTETVKSAVDPNSLDQAVLHLPLGRQLIAKGLLSEHELKDALEYQQRLPRVMHKPIGEILVMLGYISETDLQAALASQSPTTRSKMGEVLIKEGLITEWQLAHALSLQFSPEHAHKRLGVLLIELGYAKRDEIEGALARHYASSGSSSLSSNRAVPVTAEEQTIEANLKTPIHKIENPPSHIPLGQILLSKNYLTAAQLEEGLALQSKLKDEYRPIGDILIMLGYINEYQLQEALQEQPGFKREPIGQVLIRQGVIQEWQLAHALCLQFDPNTGEHRNLGLILVEQGYCTQQDIEAAVLKDLRYKRVSSAPND